MEVGDYTWDWFPSPTKFCKIILNCFVFFLFVSLHFRKFVRRRGGGWTEVYLQPSWFQNKEKEIAEYIEFMLKDMFLHFFFDHTSYIKGVDLPPGPLNIFTSLYTTKAEFDFQEEAGCDLCETKMADLQRQLRSIPDQQVL